ncbi:CRISPR-associated TM1812 family protein [Gloeomargarita lithophora Alchichica-D10]|uniref:CRISPR-associated TM1812 family protein n=1 Tax=Gloeomargarita lithophora Alchichica-D10 TaxID=1188229 RepID=A0A1J0AAJ9_9CYAN|nr:hypothetical protein [Gloeomargarita lithophora]APB32933.1 CRISPR-associated TM1812 family protein [Gloeomargarita lithophora Alchichica-D10]
MTKATEKSKDDNLNFNQPIAVHIRDARALAVFWGQLTEYRNDVAHVQMRKSPFSGKNLEDFALNRLLSSLESIFPTLTQSSDLEENNSNQR